VRKYSDKRQGEYLQWKGGNNRNQRINLNKKWNRKTLSAVVNISIGNAVGGKNAEEAERRLNGLLIFLCCV